MTEAALKSFLQSPISKATWLWIILKPSHQILLINRVCQKCDSILQLLIGSYPRSLQRSGANLNLAVFVQLRPILTLDLYDVILPAPHPLILQNQESHCVPLQQIIT